MGNKFISVSFSFLSTILTILALLLLVQQQSAMAVPLSTDSRWIVNEKGHRVKLACVNWVAHADTMVAEGLSNQPVDAISIQIAALGFNCVRLTWPDYLVANKSVEDLTVRNSFQNLGLKDAIAGIKKNNPSFLDLTLMAAFKRVVDSLGAHNVMVILDNHVSKPGWCCSETDGNGFFGDEYFLPDRWIEGLGKMAGIFKGISNVVGISLRNELRGVGENIEDWYRYMQQGAEQVHSANPDVLVILSGLNFDTDLSFIREKSVSLSFQGKLVYETHWYGHTNGDAWVNGNPNEVCGQVANNLMGAAGYLLQQGYPLFVSEFGADQGGRNENDNRYFNCFMSVAAELDLDWALWSLVGSYYYKEGVVGSDEFYGVYDSKWVHIRNPSFMKKISALQYPFQGPKLLETEIHQVIFHPSTGLCITKKPPTGPLTLGPCNEAEAWIYSPQKTLTLKETNSCLQADRLGKPPLLGTVCKDKTSTWELLSDTKMHILSTTHDDAPVCLDVDSSNTIVTNTCRCVNVDKTCDPEYQWFKLVNSTRNTIKKKIRSSNYTVRVNPRFKK